MRDFKLKRSCLRWPGNKYSLLSEIIPLINKTQFNSYHEPFMGSASVFLNLGRQERSYLSDSNSDLINFYTQVKNNLPKLIQKVKTKRNSEASYYVERQAVYRGCVDRAAQFYYLNRTCFNGIYRVNSAGIFNVPYGRREKLIVADEANLKFVKSKLGNVVLKSCDFLATNNNIQRGDLVYFDPPYSAKTNNKSFLMYNEILFSWNDQLRLQHFCRQLMERNVHIIMNNLYNEEVYNLFAKELGLNVRVTERFSGIGSQQHSRGIIKEYLFTNIP